MDGANRKRTHLIKNLYLAEEYLNGKCDKGHCYGRIRGKNKYTG